MSKIIAIIGGGAAGLMAAYFAKLNHPENQVILIERNKYLGAKVIISGGGRCNVTTGILDIKRVLENYPRGSTFLRTAIQAFPPQAIIDWFESQGVPLKTEEDLRVFPISNNGKDVVGALENALTELGVKTILGSQVTEINQTPQKQFQINFHSGETLICDKLILTTGGNAYRHTGSNGDGYAFAKALGHSITPLAPSLSSFHTSEKWTHQVSGISFKKAKITYLKDQNPSRVGPLLFTHKGLTGPAVFALSAIIAYEQFTPDNPGQISLDLFPDETAEKLEESLQKNFTCNPLKKLVNVLALTIPHRLAEKILENLHEYTPINSSNRDSLNDLTCANISKELRKVLVQNLKNITLTITGRAAGDEFVTAGGIPLEEVDHKTMQSKITPNLFFAGELLDIDGFTGGFNLQASWATGALAGESC